MAEVFGQHQARRGVQLSAMVVEAVYRLGVGEQEHRVPTVKGMNAYDNALSDDF